MTIRIVGAAGVSEAPDFMTGVPHAADPPQY
jgi:hypothetical protein